MSQTYKAIGINLKGLPFGEADRLITVLTEEQGLLRAIVPGARKYKSKIGARSSLFVVNQLLIVKGRNLDKIIQAETVESFPQLSQNLSRLTAGQYLAELVLHQALSNQPQAHLVNALRDYLRYLEQVPIALVFPYLVHGMLYFLATAGLAPQVQHCAVTQQAVHPNWDNPTWQVGFSAVAGGLVLLDAAAESPRSSPLPSPQLPLRQVAESATSRYRTVIHPAASDPIQTRLQANHVRLLQDLDAIESDVTPEDRGIPHPDQLAALGNWPDTTTWWPRLHRVEQVLRIYAQYHLERPIQSAALLGACFQVAAD